MDKNNIKRYIVSALLVILLLFIAVIAFEVATKRNPDVRIDEPTKTSTQKPILSEVAEDSAPKLFFNKAESFVCGVPLYNPDYRSIEIPVNEANEILNIDILNCIPASLKQLDIQVSKGYLIPDELTDLCISLIDLESESETQGYIYFTVCSKEWSAYRSLGNYSIESPVFGKTLFEDIVIEAFEVRQDTISFIAKFQIDDLEYYFEAHNDISEEDFSVLVYRVIEESKK